MNKVELIGAVVNADPVLRYTGSGLALVEFTVAVNGARYDSDARAQVVTTTYLTCQAWGDVGERFAEEGFTRGDEIYVMGRLDQREIRESMSGPAERKTRVVVQWWRLVRRHGKGA